MADNDVVVETVTEKSSRNNGNMKCNTKKCSVFVCVNCLSIYHQSCARRNPEFQVIEETKIKCCQLSKGNHEQGRETLLGVENKYMKELLEGAKDKNKILTLNNDLLLQRIQRLEEGNICQKRKQSDTGVATRPKTVISKHLKRDLEPAPTWKTSQSTSGTSSFCADYKGNVEQEIPTTDNTSTTAVENTKINQKPIFGMKRVSTAIHQATASNVIQELQYLD
ncbi:hypothetical protein JTB14_031301 [Gonioctena quinquepunctata]|nr:hypothetical protein JTB14_031301 [Gonioctena quinquepunctata]